MTERHAARCAAVVALCVSALCGLKANAAQFSFAAFGDVPYNAAEELQFPTMIEEMNRQTLAFVLHVGDFKHSRTECSDALFQRRVSEFSRSRHAFVFIPGDNEWTDCYLPERPRDPMERLAKLRELFFANESTLGERPMRIEQQKTRGHSEHLRWVVENVVFATFNIPGPDNHATRMPDESRDRTAAVLDWMREAFRIARERRHAGVVLAMHGNIWTGRRGYADIVSTIENEARAYDGEILVIHGDTHLFHFDRPLAARNIPNVKRLEVFGSPFATWTLVTATVENGRATFDVSPGGERGSRAQPASADR